MHHKVLIVGTVPYNEKSTSRAFDSYFHDWEAENVAQVFSNAKTPPKGHCGTLFQITDHRLLQRRFRRDILTGKEYRREELPDAWQDSALEVDNKTAALYRIGSHKHAWVYLARKWVWKRKYWCTKELNDWLDRFRPECIFLSFSDDFFIPEIALYIAQRYDIPIVSSIGDDYYFNLRFTLSPLYWLYKCSYRALIRKVLAHKGGAIYIGDKIKEQYNRHFGIDGKTVYLTSSIARRDFIPIDITAPQISYFGNIRLGRNRSLCDIADALAEIDPQYYIDVYSNENEISFFKMLQEHPNVKYHGSVPYAEVKKRTSESDILLVVEGFKKKDVDVTRYSLSTKVADSLASGAAVFAYGSSECGAIGYALSSGCIQTCIHKANLRDSLFSLITDLTLQEEHYRKAIEVVDKQFSLHRSIQVFESVIDDVVGGSCETK